MELFSIALLSYKTAKMQPAHINLIFAKGFIMKNYPAVLVAIFGLICFTAQADVFTAEKAAQDFALYAKKLNPNFALSAEAGRAFFTKKVMVRGKDLSCSSCHTINPANKGKHVVTGKDIQPMAPSVNPKRFSDIQNSAQKFAEHCKDLYGKDCTAEEKGNFITYLLSVK